MTRSDENGVPRAFFPAVLFCASLAAASGAAAQGQQIVYSTSNNDGKLSALSFSYGTHNVDAKTGSPLISASTPSTTIQDAVLTIPVGGPLALWWRAALARKHVATLLIEFPMIGQKGAVAPFAVRFYEVFVTSVHVSKPKGDAGPGIAEVKFHAARFEVFTASQAATGAMTQNRFGHNFKTHATQ